MKTKCTHCKKDISKIVNKRFDEYTIGKVQCDKCKTNQKRYISELDLMIYFGISCLTYSLSILSIFFIFDHIKNILVSSIIIVIVFIGIFFLYKYIPYYIYENAPFKSNWKNFVFKEEEKVISKRMKWQFIMFLLVSLMFGTTPQFVLYFYILITAFILIVAIKVRLLYKRELDIVNKTK